MLPVLFFIRCLTTFTPSSMTVYFLMDTSLRLNLDLEELLMGCPIPDYRDGVVIEFAFYNQVR